MSVRPNELQVVQHQSDSEPRGTRRQGIFWMLTIPHHDFTPYLPPACSWIKGQLELGAGGYLHWQIVIGCKSKSSLAAIKNTFGASCHCELTRSGAANEYIWKDDTRVEGTQFELGVKSFQRNSKTDWEAVWTSAILGKFEEIPAHTRIVSYNSLLRIAADHLEPIAMVRTVKVYWGVTGSGKSHRAWSEAGSEAYPKDPRSKFWCGYRTQVSAIIDEFRGGIDVSHLLRWFDRYPVRVEIKGSSRPLVVSKFWITSNVNPRDWYPDLDHLTWAALERRMEIVEFTEPYLAQ